MLNMNSILYVIVIYIIIHVHAIALKTNFFNFNAEDKFVILLTESTLCKHLS